MTCAYRVWQFFMRLGAHFRALDDDAARRVLAPDALALFAAMPRGDQAHGLCVLEKLESQGPVDDPLAQAALLHDVGKAGAGLTLLHRSIIVLVGALRADLLARLAGDGSRGWRYPFCAHLHHAEIGAARCRDAGCSDAVIELVRWHEGTASEWPAHLRQPLEALQHADDRC